MKMLTAINTALAAFPQRERRTALAQFIIRYTCPDVSVTHYRCIGQDADVIVKFLETLGLTKDDFTTVRSELDSETCQIRWNKTSKLVRQLMSVLNTFDTPSPDVYNSITNGDPAKIFADADEEQAAPLSTHFMSKVQSKSNEIMKWIIARNSPLANVAHSSLVNDNTCDVDNLLIDPNRPHILPVHILELYVWDTMVLPSDVEKPPYPLFTSSYCNNMTACRYMDQDDTLGFSCGIYEAPAPCLLSPSVTPSGGLNPLRGFLSNTVNDVISNISIKPNSEYLYVLTSGPFNSLIPDGLEGEPVKPYLEALEFVANPKKFWKYVASLYSTVYGLNCSIAPGSRIVVCNEWVHLFPQGACMEFDASIHSPNFFSCNNDGESDLLMGMCAGVILTPMQASTALLQERIDDSAIVTVADAINDPAKESMMMPDYVLNAPSKADLPSMWFATTHVDPSNIFPDRRDVVTGERSDCLACPSLQAQSDAMTKFRETVAHWKGKVLAKLTQCDATPSFSMEHACHTAFATMVAEVINSYIPTGDNVVTWGGTSTECHNTGLYVTNVYSGITTDLSPTLSDGTCPEHFPRVIDGPTPTPTSTEQFTEFIDNLAQGNCDAQLSMAKRSTGNPRFANVIVETNFDVNRLRDIWNSYAGKELRNKLRKAFIQSFVIRNRQIAAVASPSYTSSQFRYSVTLNDAYKDSTGVPIYDGMKIPDVTSNGYALAYDLSLLSDVYGRAYLLYRVDTSYAAYAMTAYRFQAGMPVFTKYTATRGMASAQDMLIPEEAINPSAKTCTKFIKFIIAEKLRRASVTKSDCSKLRMDTIARLNCWTPAVSCDCASWYECYPGKAFHRDMLLRLHESDAPNPNYDCGLSVCHWIE